MQEEGVFRLIFQPDPTMAKGKGHQEELAKRFKSESWRLALMSLLVVLI